ncbi:MAG: YesL family protein, partial [Bacillus sp. (in: firmicutes)]
MSPLLSLNNPVIRILSRIVDLILLNCLFILFSLPIITIGASVTALYSVTIKITKSEDSHIWKNFITSFRKNFKQSTIIWLMALVLGCILLADFYFLDYLSGVLKVFFMFVTFLFGFIYLSILLFVFPYT